MEISFSKYQGTGNDFILLDNLDGKFDSINSRLIATLCDRKFGIGADGLILVQNHSEHDFEIRYFNSDGSRSFCGNGARCAVKFANSLDLFKSECVFKAIDGTHLAKLSNNVVHLQMSNVEVVDKDGEAFVLDTGSPHYIEFVDDLAKENIIEKGKAIRFSEKYNSSGINVNLAQEIDSSISMLTYERGVEDETLSCGTGATAVAIAYAYQNKIKGLSILNMKVKGGDLQVRLNNQEGVFCDVFLIGPAEFVFKGKINVEL